MKSLFSSKTFWIAFIQAIIGVVVTFSTTYPDVGILVVGKSVLDIFLRLATTQPIGTQSIR